jgi:hypothetical protein
MVPHLYAIIVETLSQTSLGEEDVHTSFKEFIRVKDCAVMTLDRFLRFNKKIHLEAVKEYLSWGTDYEVTMEISEFPTRSIIWRVLS